MTRNGNLIIYEEDDFDTWLKDYDIMVDDDGQIIQFQASFAKEDIKALHDELDKLEPEPTKQFLHVWTAIDGEGDDVFFSNGFRRVNRLYWVIGKKKFADNIDDGLKVLIEAQ